MHATFAALSAACTHRHPPHIPLPPRCLLNVLPGRHQHSCYHPRARTWELVLILAALVGTLVSTNNTFVQHMTLHPTKIGEDNPGYVVRAKDGLDGCEYLSEVPLVKPGAVQPVVR